LIKYSLSLREPLGLLRLCSITQKRFCIYQTTRTSGWNFCFVFRKRRMWITAQRQLIFSLFLSYSSLHRGKFLNRSHSSFLLHSFQFIIQWTSYQSTTL
jgi:hypothetical protein